MKDENAFNAFLSKKFRALPRTASLKLAERHHIGISDFVLWRYGRSAAVEVKLVQDVIGRGGALLKHAFTGPQQTWLETMIRSGTLAFGVVGCASTRKMWLLPADIISHTGNWSCGDFTQLTYSDRVPEFDFDNVGGLVEMMFAHRVEDGRCLK